MMKQFERWKTPSRYLLAVSASLIFMIWAHPGLYGVERAITDDNITDVVEREFLFDSAVPRDLIDVTTVDGVVTLTGSVDNLGARERAVRIAETVKGVRSVVDRIKVMPSLFRSDDDIERDVVDALFDDPATDSYEISVDVENGHLYLGGSVDSWLERRLCANVAKGVRGIKQLTNDIKVSHSSDRPDSEILSEIEAALRWDTLVDDGLIDVQVIDGKVSLSGTVGSAAEKRQAGLDAWTGGVRSVDTSSLSVEGWARDTRLRKSKYTSVPDTSIADAVDAALMRDPRVMSFNVDTTVYAGTVTLRGVVDNLNARRAAELDARNTVGVLSVENHLKVRPVTVRSDETIESDIENALMRDPDVERFQITASVYNGTAYLSGEVDSYYEKAQADNVTSKVKGVVRVVNKLRVDDSPHAYDPYVDEWDIYGYDWYDYEPTYSFKSDWEIERDIRNELWWSPYVDADDVQISVNDSIATLTGTVDSWRERGAAADNAYEAGATYVRNELLVQ